MILYSDIHVSCCPHILQYITCYNDWSLCITEGPKGMKDENLDPNSPYQTEVTAQ